MQTTFERYLDTDYYVSNTGIVVNSITERVVECFPSGNGYSMVNIWDYNLKKNIVISVHRMVATVFIPNPLKLREVNHIDGNKENNNSKNLEWVSSSDNKKHALQSGSIKVGDASLESKLTEVDVRCILDRLRAGDTNQTLANAYHVSSGTISEIRLNRTWRHIVRDALPLSGANPIKKLTGEDIPAIREMSRKGISNPDIGRPFRVAPATIRAILLGQTWKNY